MPLTLYVDAAAWRSHLRAEVARDPGLVPVAKGNGYGFGVPLLARTAAGLGVGRIAVGTPADAAVALRTFGGDVIVLDTHAGTGGLADPGRRVVWTAGSVRAAAMLAEYGRRLIVDCRTSVLRQGITDGDLDDLRAVTGGGRAIEAFSLHLPIDRPHGSDPVAQVASWVRTLTAAGFRVGTMYVSHLEARELTALAAAFPGTGFRQRTGTRLWLGSRTALRPAATVLQAVPVRRGDRFGYRQYRSPRDGWLVTVAGGTAHGVGLQAPRTPRGLRPRARTLARSGLAAANRVRSPFTFDGHRLWFAEPPHMLVSMLLVPGDAQPPRPGMELDAQLSYTTTRFDRITMRPGQSPAGRHSGPRTVPMWTATRLTALSPDDLSEDPPAEPSAALSAPRLQESPSGVLALPSAEEARAG